MFHEIKQAPSLGECNLIKLSLLMPAVPKALSLGTAAAVLLGKERRGLETDTLWEDAWGHAAPEL